MRAGENQNAGARASAEAEDHGAVQRAFCRLCQRRAPRSRSNCAFPIEGVEAKDVDGRHVTNWVTLALHVAKIKVSIE